MFTMSVELLYFTAAWCGPCKAMKQPIAELQSEGYTITKIDVDQQRALANQYGVQAMPTFVILRGGSVVDRFVGARSKDALQAALNLAGHDG